MARRKESPLFYFEPKTDAQAKAVQIYNEHELTMLLGPAGTGKTQLAVALAIRDLTNPPTNAEGKKLQIDRVVITRPIVEAGEKLGALPGEVEEKVDPYMRPLFDCVHQVCHQAESLIDEFFEIAPLAYLRGRTMDRSIIILDEAQNCTYQQLLMFFTRLGQNSRMIITGDPDQSDIGRASGLMTWIRLLDGDDEIGIARFTDDDSVRHPLVKKILKKAANVLHGQ